MKNLDGTWLKIKIGNDYCSPEFIEFKNGEIIHFELEQNNGTVLKKLVHWNESFAELKYDFVNDNRIRIFRIGRECTVLIDTKSSTIEIEYATHYEKITPTKTTLTKKQIEEINFKAEWNNEKIPLKFNSILDSETIKELNKEFKREGQKILLEKLEETYFASIYNDGKRKTLIGIKEIDSEKAILYGFPELPYEVIAK